MEGLRRVITSALLVATATPALAQDITYQPVDPSFGGNPFNSAHLLGIANAQNKYKDPSAANTNSQADIFELPTPEPPPPSAPCLDLGVGNGSLLIGYVPVCPPSFPSSDASWAEG